MDTRHADAGQWARMGLFAVLALPLGGSGIDRTAAVEGVVEHRSFGTLEWVSPSAHAGASLVVGGPDGFLWKQAFAAGERVDFPFAAAAGGADGLYKYEVVFFPAPPLAGDADPDARTRASTRSGTFRLMNGAVVDPDLPETAGAGGGASHAHPELPGSLPAAFLENLYVIGNQCLGLDCVDGEVFDLDTLRLKETNLRIRFVDTSSSAFFPTNDWQIVANDAINGGLEKFSIEDLTAGLIPFTIEAGARNNALYVDNNGRIGIGTPNPILEVHVNDGDTPTVRLEQNGSAGLPFQTWDLGGNQVCFFLRDVTNGSRQPLRVLSGAPTDSLHVDPEGDVGLGLEAPASRLHVRKEGLSPGTDLVTYESDGAVRTAFRNTGADVTWFVNNSSAGHFLITDLDDGAPDIEFRLRPNGNLSISGSLTENSDRDTKTNVETVDRRQVLEAVTELDVTRWSFKGEPDADHIGPMAQDFYAAFGLGETETRIAPRDVAGVALLAIQGLAEEKDREIAGLQARLAALEAKLEELTEE